MNEHLIKLKDMFFKISESADVTFTEIKQKKKITGVNMIFNENQNLLSIRSTNNFNVRFRTDLSHESTHTLMKKLLRAQVHLNRSVAKSFFMNQYKYKVLECTNKREAEA